MYKVIGNGSLRISIKCFICKLLSVLPTNPFSMQSMYLSLIH